MVVMARVIASTLCREIAIFSKNPWQMTANAGFNGETAQL
jgi:hypothetical protein